MPDKPLPLEVTDDFLQRIKAEEKVRLTQALKHLATHKHDPDSVPENQRSDLGLSSYFLGRRYRYGKSAEPDYVLAFECYKFSARLGNPKACYTLGRMYLLGNKAMCIKKDFRLALEYIKMSDKQQCSVSLQKKLDSLRKTIEVVENIYRPVRKKR